MAGVGCKLMSIDITSLLMGKAMSGGGGGGGSSNIFEWDFTSATPLVDKVRGETATATNLTFGSGGAVFDATEGNKDYIRLWTIASLVTIEIDVAASELTSGTDRRFVSTGASNGRGFFYRSSGVWALYNGSTTVNSEITDANYFSGHTLKIYVDENSKWHIYRDENLVFEPDLTLNFDRYSGTSNYMFILGAAEKSLNSAIISAVRVH